MMTTTANDLSAAVRDRYARAAMTAASGSAACCNSTCCPDPITSDLYHEAETRDLPREAVNASLGCGNPTALIDLHEGQTVLDLGSGGGIDVLLAAKRVGTAGKVYGLDMTPEMLELARRNQRQAGVTNVEFLEGNIEAIPLPDDSIDVIISNCVINLALDKKQVLKEAFRVLRPGGRFAVSDVVVLDEVPNEIRRSMELWIGCVAGAVRDTAYVTALAAAGFTDISIEQWRVYDPRDASEFLSGANLSAETIRQAEGKFASAFVRATKPKTCCTSDCCA